MLDIHAKLNVYVDKIVTSNIILLINIHLLSTIFEFFIKGKYISSRFGKELRITCFLKMHNNLF